MANTHDGKAKEQTYNSFISTLKWSVPLISVLVLIILIIIS